MVVVSLLSQAVTLGRHSILNQANIAFSGFRPPKPKAGGKPPTSVCPFCPCHPSTKSTYCPSMKSKFFARLVLVPAVNIAIALHPAFECGTKKRGSRFTLMVAANSKIEERPMKSFPSKLPRPQTNKPRKGMTVRAENCRVTAIADPKFEPTTLSRAEPSIIVRE